MQVFDGNGMNGFFARDSILTGVAFLASLFNGNGASQAGGDGIRFLRSTINQGNGDSRGYSGLSSIVTLTTGFTLKDSEVVGNTMNGVEFDAVTATDVTFDNATIAENTLDGVFVHDNSHVTDFRIQNSHLGELRDSDGNLAHAGNGGNGLHIDGGTIAPQAGVAGRYRPDHRSRRDQPQWPERHPHRGWCRGARPHRHYGFHPDEHLGQWPKRHCHSCQQRRRCGYRQHDDPGQCG
jgi:hypothetical protein